MKHFILFIISMSFISTGAFATASLTKKMSVVIDPGHGGNDQGTSTLNNASKVKESDLTLKLSQKILALIEAKHSDLIAAHVTRDKNKYVGLQKRVDFTFNQAADLYLSLHYNSAFSDSISGTEIYFSSGTNKVLNDNPELSVLESIKQDVVETGRIRQSLSFAKILPTYWPAPRIKIRRAPFYVLEKSYSASLLIEVGYLTNSNDKNLILNDYHQDQAAEAIVKALVSYKEMSDKQLN